MKSSAPDAPSTEECQLSSAIFRFGLASNFTNFPFFIFLLNAIEIAARFRMMMEIGINTDGEILMSPAQ